ncbi:MAG TPA: hypothetical protein DCO72_06415 [Ruminococcus sp.]|nr:hypothetical protein [Ruminococcus sp.]
MKRNLFALLVIGVFLTGCGMEQEITTETHEMGYALQTGSYFDISDLTRNGSFQQYITVGYEGVETVSEFNDQYLSADGETYVFDAQGRLKVYRNTDTIFYNRLHSPNPKLSEEEMHSIAMDVAKCAGLDGENFTKIESSYFPENGENTAYYLSMKKEYSAGMADVFVLQLDDFGQVRSINISYNNNNPLTQKQEKYFQEQLDNYIAERAEKRPHLYSHDDEVRYYTDNGNVYALYDITFYEETDDKEYPLTYVNSVGFVTKA